MRAAHEIDGPRFAHAILSTDELLALPAQRFRSRMSWTRDSL